MRVLIILSLSFCSTTAIAQPGWRPLRVSFVLQYDGVIVPARDLPDSHHFAFVMQGRHVQAGGYGEDMNFVEFDEEVSDIMRHVDTLWMVIMHDGRHMQIGFPPRRDREHRYTADGLFIDFREGRYMVTDLHRQMHVTGTVANLDRIAAGNPYFDIMVRNGDHWSYGGVFDRATGRIDATLQCDPTVRDGRETVDLALETRNWFGQLNTTMMIRVPYWNKVDIGAFDLAGSHFRQENRELTIDTTVPRDTIIAGSHDGLEVHLHPVNPSPSDTLSIELRWAGSGAPYVSSHTLMKRKDGVTELRFSFALRTDVDVATDSWIEHARPFRVPSLPEGRYVLTQEPITGKDIATVDFLLRREVPFVCSGR